VNPAIGQSSSFDGLKSVLRRPAFGWQRAYTVGMGRIVKLLVVAVIVFAAWKYAVPWVQRQSAGTTEEAAEGGGGSCVRSAERASETWGGGLRQFANPPYDLNAWSSFRGSVESSINAAEADCDCAEESCEKARSAMRDLRALVSDLDSTVRNGSDLSDFVRRQERIDDTINEAAELARGGK
jgi:hypothetical protein